MTRPRRRARDIRSFIRLLGTCLLSVSILVTPVAAIGAQLSWEPPYVDFGAVPLSQTAYQTLTLTNEDAVYPITVTGIEFTFNQGAAFAWSAAVPTEIPPGGFLEVQLSFTPTDADSSFYMADLWIYSDSDTPALYIQLLGEVSLGDPCAPLANCGGVCVDTQNNVENCGSCFNACPVEPHGTSACEAGSCSLTCEVGYEPVGDSCEPIVSQTPLEMLQDLIAFFDKSVELGTLVGLGPGASADHRRDAFENMLDEAEELLVAMELNEACGQLRATQVRTDGGYPFIPPWDFVAGEATYALSDGLLEIMEAIAETYPGVNCEPQHIER